MLYFPRVTIGGISVVPIKIDLTFLIVGQQAPFQLFACLTFDRLLLLMQER